MKKINWRDKTVRLVVVLLMVIALAGCSSKPETGSSSEDSVGSSDSIESKPSVSPSETEGTETISSQSPASEPSSIDISGPISYETAKTLVKDMALDVTYEEIMRKNKDHYGGYEVVTRETCEELKEVLSVYFTCFFHPEIWGDYEFIDDGVIERWEEMYGKTMEYISLEEIANLGILLSHIYYEDGEDYFIQVGYTFEDVSYMHLTKTNGQWYVAEDVIGNFYGDYYSEGDRERAAALHVEALKKGREKNPVTEEMIQEGIAAIIESYIDMMWDLTPEETEALRKDMETLGLKGVYEEKWCDKILAFICTKNNDYSIGWMPGFNETAFVLWVQPEEGYDPALLDWIEDRVNGPALNGFLTSAFYDNGEYGSGGGSYYLIYEVPGEGWRTNIIFDIPKFSLRSEEWNAEWNVW